MKCWSWVMWAMLPLVGCASSQPYPYSYSGAVGPPIRYPLDYPICYERTGGGTLYVPLKLRVAGAGIPDPMVVMSLRKKNPTDDGCFTAEYSKKPARPLVSKSDSDNTGSLGAFLLDMKGNGFAAVSYRYSLLNADDLRKEAESKQKIIQTRVQNPAKLGFTYVDAVKQDEQVVINRLTWQHRLTAKYKTLDPNDASKGTLLGWDETYEHSIDGTHVLRQKGHFDAMVIADPEWINARRALLRRLVEAVRIERVSQADIDAAVADYDRRRAIDQKCGADKKCRAKEGG